MNKNQRFLDTKCSKSFNKKNKKLLIKAVIIVIVVHLIMIKSRSDVLVDAFQKVVYFPISWYSFILNDHLMSSALLRRIAYKNSINQRINQYFHNYEQPFVSPEETIMKFKNQIDVFCFSPYKNQYTLYSYLCLLQ